MNRSISFLLVAFVTCAATLAAGVKVTKAPGTIHEEDGTITGTYSIADGGDTLHIHYPGPPSSIVTWTWCSFCEQYHRGTDWIDVTPASESSIYDYDCETSGNESGHLTETN